jgi:hypothetical protein
LYQLHVFSLLGSNRLTEAAGDSTLCYTKSVRVFMVPQVAKLLNKERLPDSALCKPAREVVAGTLGAGEADLGGGLFKKRLARQGGGKSGGFRVIVAYRPPRADRVLVAYAFAKNAASTLTPQGHEALSKTAQAFVAANDEQLAELLASGDVSEVTCDADDEG